MKKEELLKRAANPAHIAGIYNYCDRWCERCEFTARCLNYETDSARHSGSGGADVNNAKFWRKMEESLNTAIELLDEMAREHGVELNSADLKTDMLKLAQQRKEARNHPVAVLSSRYAVLVDQWFRVHRDLFDAKEEELLMRFEQNSAGRQTEIEAGHIGDCMEVIRWYQTMINVKLMRGLMHEPLPGGAVNDADGSVKVALISADRSIAAWAALREYFPAETDNILDLLVILERIRRQAEEAFPNARAFVRPGFDEKDRS